MSFAGLTYFFLQRFSLERRTVILGIESKIKTPRYFDLDSSVQGAPIRFWKEFARLIWGERGMENNQFNLFRDRNWF